MIARVKAPPVPEAVAAAGAIALFALMFADWYTVDVRGGNVRGSAEFATQGAGMTAWQAFGWLDVLLFAAISFAIAQAVFRLREVTPELPVRLPLAVAVSGGLGVVGLAYRLVEPPGPDGRVFVFDVLVSVDLPGYLGLLACVAIAAGGVLMVRRAETSAAEPCPSPAG